LTFHHTDVTLWKDLVALFNAAKAQHSRIDHVFANAGISYTADYLSTETDENGNLKEPTWICEEVCLRACINTATLGIFHMRPDRGGHGGSIVVTASIAAFTHYRGVDYTASKHGVLGFMRGMHTLLGAADLPIRINAIAPSWTYSGLVPRELLDVVGIQGQPPEAAARSALILMADGTRTGQLMHSAHERFKEIEESIFASAVLQVIGTDEPTEDEVLAMALKMRDSGQNPSNRPTQT
jgi:NAD(P)-dependent dehydrogenase (short-subunit alcohol dehydrogenase family)